MFKWSKWINPTKIFKNLTITPFYKTFTIFVLTKVPGDTYWSSYILDKSSSSRPLKFIATYSSEARVTLRIFLFSSISFTTTMTCLSSVNSANYYYPTKDLGRKILYFLSPDTIKIQPNYYLDLIWAGKDWPILIFFSSMVKNELSESWTWWGFIPLTTVPITNSPGWSYFSKTSWFFFSLLKREIYL